MIVEDILVAKKGIQGQLLSPADGSVTDAKIAANAAIASAKMLHRHKARHGQPNTTATTETRWVYTAVAAGNVYDVTALCDTTAVGAATLTIDIKKSTGGGAYASILSSVITISSSTTAKTTVTGAIASVGYIAGDQFQVVITATASGGTLPTGVGVQVTFDEQPN